MSRLEDELFLIKLCKEINEDRWNKQIKDMMDNDPILNSGGHVSYAWDYIATEFIKEELKLRGNDKMK